MAQRRLKLLTFTTLFPSAAQPRHGIFVETRLAHVRRCTGAALEVVAPVAWYPFTHECFGRFAAYARTPRREVRDGVTIRHPRYLTLSGVGVYTQPAALTLCGAAAIRAVQREGYAFDLIDAHYLYPDGVAAAALARRFGKPLVLTARGSDVNRLMQLPVPRRRILAAIAQAQAVITVSGALRDRLVEAGVDAARISVLRNGVDMAMFRPEPRAEARSALGLGPGPVLAAVGNLVEEKGHALMIAALASLPDATLVIVGRGPEQERLATQAQALGVAERVRFLPERPQRDLAAVYSAADALVLASSREGWPNVLLEAMACGTPVVATRVGGVPEIVTDPVAGIVVAERTPATLAAALQALLAAPRAADAVRAYASRFGWDDVARAQGALYRDVVAARADVRYCGAAP